MPKIFNAYEPIINNRRQARGISCSKSIFLTKMYSVNEMFSWEKNSWTWVISSGVLIINALLFKSVITASTALFIPLRKSITFTPAAIDLHPSVSIAWVKTVAQVVPVIKEETSTCKIYEWLQKRKGNR